MASHLKTGHEEALVDWFETSVRLLPSSCLRGLSSLGAVVALGCSGAAAPARTAAGERPQPVIEVPPVVVSPYSDAELAREFERGSALLLADRFEEAAALFEKLERLAPQGEVAAPSLHNAGVAREALGERERAAAHYGELLRRFPDHAAAKGGALRLARVEAYLERWPELAKVAERLLARTDLTILETIEARGARGLALVEQDRADEAMRDVAAARDLIEQHRLGEAGRPPLELAQVSFALGEVRRVKSERIVFVPLPPNFGDVLEQRCQGLLDAQNAYTEAMRSFDAHWSAMAGYRVGQLYQQLHRDVMRIQPPAAADTLKKKQLFEGAMRLRYRVLLEKGLKMMDATVALGERTGESSPWVARARQARKDLELALEDEKAALAKMPFTEADLQAALDQLKARP
jgi:tetratricopeptide (TPR) repeat protein